jgi:hypothetical protein
MLNKHTSGYSFLINRMIYEYDLEHASISVMRSSGLVADEIIDWLETLPKHERVVNTGLLLKENRELNKFLIPEIDRIVNIFIEKNKLEDSDILLVRRDAVFIIDKRPHVTVIDNYNFRLKNKFDTFINIDRQIKLFYYSLDQKITTSGNFKLPDVVNDFLCEVLDNIYTKNLDLNFINTFTKNYFEGNLVDDFYYSFNTLDKGFILPNKVLTLVTPYYTNAGQDKKLSKDENYFNFFHIVFKHILEYIY